MLNYFYDSLDTLKQVKKPTKQEIWKMVLQIVIVVAIGAAFFILVDSFFASLSKMATKAFIQ